MKTILPIGLDKQCKYWSGIGCLTREPWRATAKEVIVYGVGILTMTPTLEELIADCCCVNKRASPWRMFLRETTMSLVCFGLGEEAALNHTVALTHSLHQENDRNWNCIGWLTKIDWLLQVYYVAKQCSDRCSAEEYAIALARHFVKTYPLVSHKLDIVSCSMPSSQYAL